MLEQLSSQVRVLVYVVICFQCLLQLTEGSSYQRYLKLFSYLLILCISCNILLSLMGKAQEDWIQADVLCEEWMGEWQDAYTSETETLQQYHELLEEKILKEAREEYSRREEEDEQGGTQNVGDNEELSGQSQTWQ